jgi:hypothetical protein
MKLYIYNKATSDFVTETTNSKVYLDSRIDEVLHQVQCDFYSTNFVKNIAPFTPCYFLNGNVKSYWFISTFATNVLLQKVNIITTQL